jgi:vacuolar-type H+-ATPase subunit H
MYGDAGSRLRNEANWDKQEADYKQQLEEKQKALADAKQNMEDMQEDARKSGVPSAVIENAQKPAPTNTPN